MKIKTTKQFIKSHCQKVFAIGYCDLQYLLQYKNAFAYSAGVYGWACDYYDLGAGFILSTGYSPIGDRLDYKLVRDYEKKAEKIANNYNLKYETKQKKINKLYDEFVSAITNNQ